MSERCPNCDRPALGQDAMLLLRRGTLVSESAVKCNCGTVWVDEERPEDEHGDTLAELVDRSREQGKPEWMES